MSLTTGRTLDAPGEPQPGTGFEIDPDGEIAARLRERSAPLLSNPVTGEWTTVLEPPAATDGESATGLGVFAAGNDGPPAHYHVGYEETFAVLRGEFVVEIEGDARHLSAGEELTVQPGTEHTFRNVGDEVGATVTTTRPPARTLDVIETLYGLAHDGELSEEGDPGFFQGMAMAAEFSDDTVFTSPPPAVTRSLAALVAPIAHRLGYRATYPRYADPGFWERRVEQPSP